MAFRGLFGRSDIPQVSPTEAKQKHEAGAVLVDVRELHEWREGHIPGALHIPLGDLPARVHELDNTKEIVAVCRSGGRSMTAAKILVSSGFVRVHNLAGGMISWSEHGLTVQR